MKFTKAELEALYRRCVRADQRKYHIAKAGEIINKLTGGEKGGGPPEGVAKESAAHIVALIKEHGAKSEPKPIEFVSLIVPVEETTPKPVETQPVFVDKPIPEVSTELDTKPEVPVSVESVKESFIEEPLAKPVVESSDTIVEGEKKRSKKRSS